MKLFHPHINQLDEFKHTIRTSIDGRQIVINNFLVVDNKILSMTKHPVCDSIFRLQTVKNKAVDNKLVFFFQKENYFSCFVIGNSLSPVCEQVSTSHASKQMYNINMLRKANVVFKSKFLQRVIL